MTASKLQTLDEIFEHNRNYYKDDLTEYSRNKFRILGINPGKFSDPLICRLRTVPLRKDLAYGALSYSWGDGSGWEDITINGEPGFKVTASVFGALRRLRHPQKTRCLWIDAVCINQSNIKERNSQVAQMAKIFQYAELAYVYLGQCGLKKHHSQELEKCQDHIVHWDGTVDVAAHTDKTKSPLCAVENSDKVQFYWRTWTVQEVALARKIAVLIGPHLLSWHKTLETFEDLGLSTSAHRQAYKQLLRCDTVRAKRQWISGHLRYLLHLTALHVATDWRDKVYGVLGLLKTAEGTASISPDYAKTYEEVCMDATLHLIESESSLDILVEEWPRCLNGPSWALDFASGFRYPASLLQRDETNYLMPPQEMGNTLRCCASKEAKPQYRTDGSNLLLSGFRIDKIVSTVHADGQSQGWFQVDSLDNIGTGVFNFANQEGSNAPQDLDRAREHALAWLGRLADERRTNCPMPVRQRLPSIDLEEQFARSVSMDWYLRTEKNGQIRPKDFSYHASGFQKHKAHPLFQECAWLSLKGRRFFISEGGLCGIASADVRAGDIIVVFRGASMPMVLQPASTFNVYHLVSECYVSGIMYGEIMGSNLMKFEEEFCIG